MLNVISPTKQAKPMATKVEKGNSGKEPKLHHVAEWRKKTLGEPRYEVRLV